jgi:hypothetical protein
MKRALIENAAFWHEAVCLDCETVQPLPAPGEPLCVACGGDAVYGAEFILSCADFTEEDGDE